MSHSTAEAGELSPRDPVEGRGHRQVAPVEGKTANTPRLGPVSTSRQRIAELARQALGMAVAIAWLPGPAGTRRRVAKPSVEEPDAAEPARPDLWGARVSNDPGLPDPNEVRLQLSVLAYNLGNLWRRLVLPTRIERWSLTRLQQRLVKIGGRLVKHARYYWLLPAESHLTRRLFGSMLRRILALPVPTG